MTHTNAKPFLTVISWTYKRPTLLKKQQDSLAMQTCQEFNQIVTVDDRGIGIPAVHAALQKTDCETPYIWIFDDDDIITDPTFIEKVKAVADKERPDVIFCKSQHTPVLVHPDTWPIEFAHISNINYIVSQEVWLRYRMCYTAESGGDGHFILAVLKNNPLLKIAWVDGVMLATQRISKGRTEEQTEDHEELGEWIKVTETCAGTDGVFRKDQELKIDDTNRRALAELIRCGRAVYRDRPFRGAANQGG